MRFHKPPGGKQILLSLILLTLVQLSLAQNLESIGKEKPVRISGGVSLNQIVYGVKGIESRRDPYSYFASGNINFSLYGWNVPLSFSVSNQNTSFQQPFNQYSLHPTYKWVTGHFGYTSMSYSPYTVGGHIFLGAAIDAAPEGKFKFSGLYGRFLKAVKYDTATNAPLPAFQRMGYGFKVDYGSGNDVVNLILFHAQDERNSINIPDSVLEQKGVLPQENLVVSIAAGKTLFKHFVVKAELATSALSRDTRAEESNQSGALAHNFVYTSRISSSYYKAFKSSLSYQQNGYSLGVNYERIDPQYKTLGAYYFNSDLENITVNAATAILHGKMTVAINAGTQRDNLDKSKVSTMRRLVSAVNVGYAPSQKLNLSASYSNFQTYTNIRSQFQTINQLTPYENLDTLNYTQISQNATLMAMYSLGNKKDKRQNLNLNLTLQNAADKQGEVKQNSGVRFYNTNLSYALNLVPQNTTASLSFNTTISKGANTNTTTLGPTLSLSRSFFDKKLRGTLSSSYNSTSSNGKQLNSIINGRVNGSWTIQKKHNLNLSLVVVNRDTKTQGAARAFTEFTGTLGYSYSFGN
jgi:hypothetical protein